MFRSVRGRITLIATAVVALALLVASMLILQMVEHDMVATTERALAAELELEAQFFDFDADAQFFEFDANQRAYGLGLFIEEDGLAFGSIFDPFSDEEIAVVVIDVGLVRVEEIFDPITGDTISDPELAEAIEELNFDFRDLDGDEGNRLLVGAVARDEVDASLDAVRDALTLIVPALTLLVGLLIWVMVGRALQPVQAISDRVQAITTSSLDQRVPEPAGEDEISGLAKVMNGMLARLERGDARQRQFAADASHELRSPLSTVRAAAEMIELNPESGRAPTLAADIVVEADRMDTLIGDLLELSRIDEELASTRHTQVDLSALASGFDQVQLQIQPGVAVTGDEKQLRRAIENLLKNAHRHATSTVALHLQTLEHEGRNYALLTVEDDGDGVPVEQRAAIFERFSRLDQARSRDLGGAGLGLSLVQAIATRHGGSISVDDSPALGGARFGLHIPLIGG